MAAPQSVRWTLNEDRNADLTHVLEVIRKKTGIELSTTDFTVIESRNLATSHYLMLAQVAAGVPIQSQSLRIWTDLKSGDAIQVEARVDVPLPRTNEMADDLRQGLSQGATMLLVQKAIKKQGDDVFIRKVDTKDVWRDGALVRVVKVKGKLGTHKVVISLSNRKILENSYEEFPQADQVSEFSLPAQVYPIYEIDEASGTLMPRITSELRYLKSKVRRPTSDPFAPMKTVRYQDDHYHPLLGLTVAGRKAGFWAMSFLKQQAASLVEQLPLVDNNFTNGISLEGRYATVSLYPDVVTKFTPLSFKPAMGSQFFPSFAPMADVAGHYEMIPLPGLLGKPITSADDVFNRPAQRDPNHNASVYLNDGFDEVQVYWAVTQMFDSLIPMGFTDPDLSTRPFHAYLFNADISYRDNAFYTDDTINFTTYSAGNPNMARDNSTIWHELGHGVMDRLMGDEIELADTGGLSEGMADFIAQLVINDVTGGTPFTGSDALRIFNKTGFNLTNEVHDDGESYGGAMNDLLRTAMARLGRPGLVKVTDLTLETMRLTRNYPGLTASDWFEHMLFADSLGSSLRAPNELKALITQSLNGRNFVFGTGPVAEVSLKNDGKEVDAYGPGSRRSPIPLTMAPEEKADFTLTTVLKSTDTYKFKYPVTVKVELVKGPLQGAIHWVGEEQNPKVFTINSEAEALSIPLSVVGKCDAVNRPDGSCVDFAYVQVFNNGETKQPQSKKRFYLRIFPK